MKKLVKSTTNKKIAGVLGGIADRYGFNANVLRIAYVLAALFTAGLPFVIVYAVLAMVLPKESGPYGA
ncbi:PspC domain-containing protein [Bacillus mangrovi]|uniref:PspC domain-containing protein n=1 Tax=Metabacillus mangrovi TaxID=1491830 RepID=A0A7X2S504_9BACI|nr:PspC domain-containing protein [Metabacillus mangrovi]MTH53769.1 PspC domain-containing protein [Metabacillus mangrovi]